MVAIMIEALIIVDENHSLILHGPDEKIILPCPDFYNQNAL